MPSCGQPAAFSVQPADDPNFGTDACVAHLGELVGHDPDRDPPSHYVVEGIAA